MVNRIARQALPIGYGVAGACLLVAAALAQSAGALAAAALLAALLLAALADPPQPARRRRRRRAAGRLAAAATTLALGTIAVVATLASGFNLPTRWPVVVAAAGLAAVALAAPAPLLRRLDLDGPRLRSERTTLLRGCAVALALLVAVLVSAYALPAVEAAVGVIFGLLAALEGVALGRPGGAGLRRVATPEEARAVESAVLHAPGEVQGHRRLVVRATGGAEYLSVEVLVDRVAGAARLEEIGLRLEHDIKQALPELVVDVRVVVDPSAAPPPGPEPTTAHEEPTRRLPVLDAPPGPVREGSEEVLPSAPWQED